VIFLKIDRIDIKYHDINSLCSATFDNIKHIKSLPYLSIVQSVEGSYDIALGAGKTYQTGDGGFFVAPSNVQQTIVHHANPKSGIVFCRWLFIDIEINRTFKLDSLYCFPVVINDERKNELNRLFDLLFATDNIWKIYSYYYEIIVFLMQFGTLMQNAINPGLEKVCSYIADYFMEQMSIADLAKIANMSESNLYACFKKHFGTSPIAYLNRRRLSIAADKLLATDDTISEISSSVGISDPFYFSKIFKKSFDVSPREYRSMLKK